MLKNYEATKSEVVPKKYARESCCMIWEGQVYSTCISIMQDEQDLIDMPQTAAQKSWVRISVWGQNEEFWRQISPMLVQEESF